MRVWPTAILVAGIISTVEGFQPTGYFWWNVRIDESDQLINVEAPTFVMYGPQDSVNFLWTFKNDEGPDSISLSASALQKGTQLVIWSNGGETALSIAWEAAGKKVSPQGSIAISADDQVELQPGDRLDWNLTVKRANFEPWALGDYQVVIDVAAGLSTLTANGKPWRGRSVSEGKLLVRISGTDSVSSRKAAYRLKGSRALAIGRPTEAVAHYRALVAADPTDRSGYVGLGLALAEARQYREAAGALEIALPLVINEKSPVPEKLAFIYVLLGDDASAIRVLRLVVAPANVQTRLSQLRAIAARQ